jgi:hypothetical protein
MSRNAIHRGATPANKKPYCKVCFDAGKPESEYTSHWVRSLPDRNGKSNVTCPTLLSTECRYCYELGHTAKFCPILEKSKKENERADRRSQGVSERQTRSDTRKEQEVKKPSSLFDALRDDSDSEEEVKVSKPVENFPVLGAPAKKVEVTLPKTEPEVKTGWAAIVSKPKEDNFMKQIEERSLLKSLPQSVVKPKPEAKSAPWAAKTPVLTKSWADWSDSDEDDDETPSSPVYYRSQTSLAQEEIDEDW